MKKLIILSLALLFFGFAYAGKKDETLLTIEGKGVKKEISKDEFIRIYNKNNNPANQNQKTIDEYLVLYTNFSLKVAEAQALGMDTIKEFINEYKGYRNQLAQPYLTDRDYNKKLMREAYGFMQKDLNASHIMIKIDFSKASPKDTLKAYNKLMEAREAIKSGDSFGKWAKKLSDHERSAKRDGRLGWFTAFKFPYGFEKAAYNMEVGEISKPVRSVVGYHLIKLNNKRKAAGEIKVAHIFKVAPQNLSENEADSIKSVVNEVYEKIKSGAEFSELAKQYSDDKRSAKNGGELPWFGAGRMIPEFEEAALSLEENGDISKPIEVDFGYFIIKRIDKRGIPSYEEALKKIEKEYSKGPRLAAINKHFADSIKELYNYFLNKETLQKFYTIDSNYFTGNTGIASYLDTSKTLFRLNDKKISASGFADFLSGKKAGTKNIPVKTFVNNSFSEYIDNYAVDYEDSRLDEKYVDFRDLTREYYEGILLFNIMDEKVWSKAVTDTAGLKAFYRDNREDYMWEERAEASKFITKDEKKANFLNKYLKKNKKDLSDREIIDKVLSKVNEGDTIFLEDQLYTKRQDSLVANNWEPGLTDALKTKDSYVIIKIEKIVQPEPKKLDEARGEVIADYQDFLEKEWINELRKTYDINVNKSALSKLIEEYND